VELIKYRYLITVCCDQTQRSKRENNKFSNEKAIKANKAREKRQRKATPEEIL